MLDTFTYQQFKKLLLNILISARPNTWLRIWGEMIVAAALASYPYFDLVRFTAVFVATSPLLWSAAYMLNDITDTRFDTQHPLRKTRPITRGEVDREKTLVFVVILCLLALIVGFTINLVVFMLLFLLLSSQLLYTLPPVRFKERFFWDIMINTINSALRFFLGWFSQNIIHPFVVYPLIFFISIKVIFFIGHRMQNKVLEEENKIRSTITLLSKTQLYFLVTFFILVSVVSYVFCLLRDIFPLTSIIGAVVTFLSLLFYLYKNNFYLLIAQEQSLDFRNFLYLEYFFFTNILALTILLK